MGFGKLIRVLLLIIIIAMAVYIIMKSNFIDNLKYFLSFAA